MERDRPPSLQMSRINPICLITQWWPTNMRYPTSAPTPIRVGYQAYSVIRHQVLRPRWRPMPAVDRSRRSGAKYRCFLENEIPWFARMRDACLAFGFCLALIAYLTCFCRRLLLIPQVFFPFSVIQVGVLPLIVGWVYMDVREWFLCFFIHPRRGPCSYSDGFWRKFLLHIAQGDIIKNQAWRYITSEIHDMVDLAVAII